MLSSTDSLRKRKGAVKVIQELDAFPKIPDSYKETTASGGTGKMMGLYECLKKEFSTPF